MRILLGIVISNVMLAANVFACAYNVRDVGFVVLDSSPYTLTVKIPKDTDPALVEEIEDILFFKLLDSNVKGVVEKVDNIGTAWLKNAEGDGIQIPIPSDLKETKLLEKIINDVVHSDVRQEIQEAATDHYAVILLFEGKNEEENKQFYEEAKSAVNKITARMNMLPKEITNPPVIKRVPWDGTVYDLVLHWSVGASNPRENNYAVVLYGRARMMGDLLTNDEITETRLLEYMSIIGSDCECGLDRSWMQGTMLPARWDAPLLQRITSSAGFDPENPRTKMEISMTLNKSKVNKDGAENKGRSDDAILKDLYAYSEASVDFGDEEAPELNASLAEEVEKEVVVEESAEENLVTDEDVARVLEEQKEKQAADKQLYLILCSFIFVFIMVGGYVSQQRNIKARGNNNE